MQNKFIEYNSGNLFQYVQGRGDCLTFLHGFTLNHNQWRPQIKHFIKTNKILVYDLRGFGKSSTPIKPYSHHSDLKALLDFNKIVKTNICIINII